MDLKERIKRVAIYLRKSRDNEGEESDTTLAKHRNRLLEIAKKNNWEHEIFQEVESSMDSNRPEYRRMIHQLKEYLFDAVLSVNLARVTRDDAETPKFMRLLREEDILFITDSERIYDLEVQEDWQALKFTGFVNNWEYENIRAQLRKGKIDSAKMGRWSNGTPNYGYIYNRLERKLEIDEEKAEAVKLVFQMAIGGIGADNIAVALNQLGYRTNRGNFFHGQSITRMIRSPIYKGRIVSNRLKGRNEYHGKVRPEDQWIIAENAAPIIIDEDTWDLANEKLDQRKQLSPRAKQRRHGLSNIIKCALCGRTHSVTIRKDRNNRKEIKPCNKKNQLGESCYNRGINYYTMMELIIDSIRTQRTHIITELKKLKEERRPNIDTKSQKIGIIEDRIKKVSRALEMLQIQLEEELIDLENFKERKKKRTIELNNLQKELKKLQDTTEEDEIKSKESVIKRLDFFLNNWQQLDDSMLNETLMSFISKVIWHYPKGSKEPPKLTIEWLE
ncbi:recombinase family protein [Bacillus swezeyi]|uniref:recombinase family protein n=1 Tax=Bacillus swezeyi TaxID=1925020 RepID=UPI002E2217DE|nr:recombinase family protein [Bacillus swezeyi]